MKVLPLTLSIGQLALPCKRLAGKVSSGVEFLRDLAQSTANLRRAMLAHERVALATEKRLEKREDMLAEIRKFQKFNAHQEKNGEMMQEILAKQIVTNETVTKIDEGQDKLMANQKANHAELKEMLVEYQEELAETKAELEDVYGRLRVLEEKLLLVNEFSQ